MMEPPSLLSQGVLLNVLISLVVAFVVAYAKEIVNAFVAAMYGRYREYMSKEKRRIVREAQAFYENETLLKTAATRVNDALVSATGFLILGEVVLWGASIHHEMTKAGVKVGVLETSVYEQFSTLIFLVSAYFSHGIAGAAYGYYRRRSGPVKRAFRKHLRASMGQSGNALKDATKRY